MIFFILAEIGYRSSQVFYDALLPQIARPDEMGKISGIGWAIGSLGGIVALVVVLIPILLSDSNPSIVRISFIITAIFYAVASIPIFLWLPEKGQAQAGMRHSKCPDTDVRQGITQLADHHLKPVHEGLDKIHDESADPVSFSCSLNPSIVFFFASILLFLGAER